MAGRVVDFYNGVHEAYWDAENVIRERRRDMAHEKHRVSPALLDLMRTVFVAIVVITLVTVDDLDRGQQIALALVYFIWAAAYGAVTVLEARR